MVLPDIISLLYSGEFGPFGYGDRDRFPAVGYVAECLLVTAEWACYHGYIMMLLCVHVYSVVAEG